MKEMIIECSSCKGTGLFRGCAERGGAAVICYQCDGTGKKTFHFTEFTGRKIRNDVKRVYTTTARYVISDEDAKTENGKIIRFSQFGCSYQDWLAGKEPIPIKDLICPYQYKNNGVGNEPLDRCRRHCQGMGRIDSCTAFGDIQTCWELFDSIYKGDQK